jgi:hypothetical protein
MTWVLIIGVAWLAVSVVAALVIGRAIRVADDKERGASLEPLDVPEDDGSIPVATREDVGPDRCASEPTARPAPVSARKRIPARRGRRATVRNPVASPERPLHRDASGAA